MTTAAQTVTLSGGALHGVGPHVPSLLDLPQQVKLGRKRPKARPPALRFANYHARDVAAVQPPVSINRRDGAAAALARTYLNDQLGCCVIAGKMHALGLWASGHGGRDVEATDREVYDQYQGICGPGDQGCVITDVLDVMRARGLTAGGRPYKIDGYVACDWTDRHEVQVVQYLFAAGTVGINLPQAWTEEAVWDVTDTRVVGGHDVTPIDYDAGGVYVSSWGRIYLITWRAFCSRAWVEEYYALLSPLWYGSDDLAPCGVDAATLRADLEKLSHGELPDLPGTNPPPEPPQPGTDPVVYMIGYDAQNREVRRYHSV